MNSSSSNEIVDITDSSQESYNSKSEKIKNRKPTGKKVKKPKATYDVELVNKTYHSRSPSTTSICQDTGETSEQIQDKTAAVKFNSNLVTEIKEDSLGPTSSRGDVTLTEADLTLVESSEGDVTLTEAADVRDIAAELPNHEIEQTDDFSTVVNNEVITNGEGVNSDNKIANNNPTPPASTPSTTSKIPIHVRRLSVQETKPIQEAKKPKPSGIPKLQKSIDVKN